MLVNIVFGILILVLYISVYWNKRIITKYITYNDYRLNCNYRYLSVELERIQYRNGQRFKALEDLYVDIKQDIYNIKDDMKLLDEKAEEIIDLREKVKEIDNNVSKSLLLMTAEIIQLKLDSK